MSELNYYCSSRHYDEVGKFTAAAGFCWFEKSKGFVLTHVKLKL